MHDMGVAVALEAEHGSALGQAPRLGCEPHLSGAAADLVSVRAVGLGEGGEAPAELDHVAVAVLLVVEEREVGADRIERHPLAVAASKPVMDRLQTEKLVPQPQAAVVFGFLILERRAHQIVDVVDLRAREVGEREESTSTLAPARSIAMSSGSALGTRSKWYSKPEQPLPATLTRSMLFSGSLETICAMRSAARSVTVTDTVMTCVPSL